MFAKDRLCEVSPRSRDYEKNLNISIVNPNPTTDGTTRWSLDTLLDLSCALEICNWNLLLQEDVTKNQMFLYLVQILVYIVQNIIDFYKKLSFFFHRDPMHRLPALYVYGYGIFVTFSQDEVSKTYEKWIHSVLTS